MPVHARRRPLCGALLALSLAAPAAHAQANRPTPASTGVPECDQMATAWRACINASPRSVQERNFSLAEVDRFMRDVFYSRGGGHDGLVRACGPGAEGYRVMMTNGTCSGNTTGTRDDIPRPPAAR